MNPSPIDPKPFYRHALLLSLLLVLARLLTLNFPDLVDTTEGRYAGIAQLMLRRDDWVTPWIHLRGVEKPYLGKPPLHFWMVQVSFLLFGQNNFAARLPGVVSNAGIAALIWVTCRSLIGAQAAVVALAVFASSCMVFFLGGSVILDVTLTLGITATLVGFILADRNKLWGYLFFAGMGFGVLAKGPLACVLVVGILAPWLLIQRVLLKRWPSQLTRLPWFSGFLLFLLVVVPWYIWAEIRNPGFLRYFLINENFGRYLKTDYGDEYGTGHRQPLGTAWAMFFLAIVPWSVVAVASLIARFKQVASRAAVISAAKDSLLLFSLCWTLSCPVLLLGARQYTATYLFPSLPGFALLAGVTWSRYCGGLWLSEHLVRRIIFLSGMTICCLGVIGSLIALAYNGGYIYITTSLLASLVGMYFLISRRAALTAYNLVLSLAVLTTIIYSAATMCFNNHLSNQRSSRRVLHAANKMVPAGSPLRIAFPYYYPFSAAFYAKELNRAEVTLTYFEETVGDTSNVDLLLVRKAGNMRRVMADCSSCQEVGRVGHWYIVKPPR